jgi:hypothetical protein
MPRRIVRLHHAQVAAAIGDVLGDELASTLRGQFSIDGRDRRFLQLAHEGATVSETVFAVSDGMAQVASEYVRSHFGELSGCGNPPTRTCGVRFVHDLAERAFRRPLSEAERASLLQVLSESESSGGSVAEAVQYGAYAVFTSPWFLYRTELGSSGEVTPELQLTPHEFASELAFFLTDRPPDSALLAAAADGTLATAQQIEAQVDRLLATPAARGNLERAVLDYFGVRGALAADVNPLRYPTFNAALAAAMVAESQAFVAGTLWNSALGELITSRRTRVNAPLAQLYGVLFPPTGAALDAQGFADADLPATRSGILTQAAFLTSHSAYDGPSTVARGILVSRLLVCRPVAEPPAGHPSVDPGPVGGTERERVEVRMQQEQCRTCHGEFDPFGLVLDTFDGIGAYRSLDDQGRPINPASELPDSLGGDRVQNAVELGTWLASHSFTRCLAEAFLDYALADALPARPLCDVEAVARAHAGAGDPSFAGLVRRIALSKALAVRGTSEP